LAADRFPPITPVALQSGQTRLRLTEIFHSLQGESSRVGLPTVFIRLTGCPLRCRYCDTAYAFSGGQWHSIDGICDQVAQFETRFVCVTGGEPLAQRGCLALLERLCDDGYQVSLETSGAIDAHAVDPRVMRVIDVKTPDSGESDRNLWSNLEHLRHDDEIKFVICSRLDYEWAREQVRSRKLEAAGAVLFSPSHDQLPAAELADWVLGDRLGVRLQVQMHKVLWGSEPGR
jgi:7-carboxy-7-deazaguanine synthase